MNLLHSVSKFSVLLGILTACLLLKMVEPGFLTAMQLKWFDAYQAAKPRAYEDLPVKIVDIDDASLAKIGQWPWPRTEVAQLVRVLGEAGAAAIVFDMTFAEPDRTSPKHMQTLWRLEGKALDTLPDHDEVLAKEIAKWPVVVGSILGQQSIKSSEVKTGFAFVGGDPTVHITAFGGVIPNLPALEAAATGNGMLNSDPDADGILRKVPLLFRVGNKIYPSLSVEALRVAQGASSVIVKSVGGEETEAISAMKIGTTQVSTDASGKFWVYYNHSQKSRYIPAWQVMTKSMDVDELAGQIVLIGTSAPGLKDIRSTPLNPIIAGVEVHAQLLEQMMQQIALVKPSWSKGAEALMLVVASLLVFWVCVRFTAIFSAIGFLTVLASVWAFSWWAFDQHRLLLEPITAWIAVVFVYFTMVVWRFASTERDKSKIRSSFSLYVSESLVNELADHPEKLKLGGEKKDVTILFCDIRSFSAISERLDPSALTRLINEYLTPMTDIIMQSGGTIDKYMGDAIMAMWNAPLDVKGHPERAVQAALTMRTRLTQLNQQWLQDPEVAGSIALPIRFGIGINSGECSVGNMGSNQRFEYSVLGNDVDVASRLEGMSKYYGMDIIVSERTYSRAQDVTAMLLDTIRVKGKEEPIQIYGVLADNSLAGNRLYQDLLAEHQLMLAAYAKKHWREVEAHIGECRFIASHIPLPQLAVLYNLYESRVAEYRLTPPEEGWDGVFNADFK